MTENRSVWVSSLTIAALVALTLSNAFGSVWSGLSVCSPAWSMCNLAAALTQWALPSLVAVVGYTFLTAKRKWRMSVLWKRVIPPCALSCLIWWLSSAAIWIQKNYPQDLDLLTFRECMAAVLEEPANICFCQMLVSFFILYPLLWRIAENRRLMLYTLILFFVMGLLEPFLSVLPYVSMVTMFTHQLNWGYFRAWTFYIFLSVYFAKYEPQWPVRLLLYCAGIIATGGMAALTSWKTNLAVGYVNEYIGFSSPLTGIQTAAVILLFRHCLASCRAPLLTELASGAWSLPPLLFCSSFFAERLIFSASSDAIYSVLITAISTAIVLGLFCMMKKLPGFRCLVGIYSAQGGNKL